MLRNKEREVILEVHMREEEAPEGCTQRRDKIGVCYKYIQFGWRIQIDDGSKDEMETASNRDHTLSEMGEDSNESEDSYTVENLLVYFIIDKISRSHKEFVVENELEPSYLEPNQRIVFLSKKPEE